MQQLKFSSLFAFTLAVRLESRPEQKNLAQLHAHTRARDLTPCNDPVEECTQEELCTVFSAGLCPEPTFPDGDCPDSTIFCDGAANACVDLDQFEFITSVDFSEPPYSYLAYLCTNGCDDTEGFGACGDLGCRCNNSGCEIPRDLDHMVGVSVQTGLIIDDPCDTVCDYIGCASCDEDVTSNIPTCCANSAAEDCCTDSDSSPVCCLLQDGNDGCIPLSELLPRCWLPECGGQ
jgi:hypothetical protein